MTVEDVIERLQKWDAKYGVGVRHLVADTEVRLALLGLTARAR